MKPLLILLFIIAIATSTIDARKLPRIKRIAATPTEQFDTIASPRPDSVRFSGYEKTNPSNRETFFITNNLGPDSTIVALEVTLTYFDADGKKLHERTETVRCILPPGETRATAISTWDSNHAFHYYLSQPPVRRRSSSFSVRSRLRSLVLDLGETK